MKKARLAALVFLASACSSAPPAAIAPGPQAAPAAAEADPAPPAGLRLPTFAAPVAQAVTLTLVPADDRIDGVTSIEVAFREPSAVLWLHAADLAIDHAHLDVAGVSRPVRVVPGGEGTVGFALGGPVSGAATLHVAFHGSVSGSDDRGVFRQEEGGLPYLFTQFENTDARRAFPCFDEPSYKIPWEVTLRVRAPDQAISNTRAEAETTSADGWKIVRFARTKPLPSYLVAFAVGPFEIVDAGKAGKNGVPLRVVTPKGEADRAAFAAASTADIVARLEAYFGTPYPYDKMDVVPIPRLASFGAMENAGMITVAKRLSLATKAEQSLAFERAYVDVMAHELAHQWFGNLVTMAFWDDLWLNEGFATWMGNKIVQQGHPAWRFDLSRRTDAAGAMQDDALLSARKIRQEIATDDDIQNAFDGITYEKGATVIGMFEGWMGEAPFQAGIQRYLANHPHGNATSAAFLADLEAGSGKPVAQALSTFLDQPGVPLVTATLRCDAAGARLALSQERYLPAGSKGDARGSSWQTPVCVRHQAGKGSKRACTLLAGHEGELALPAAKGCPAWVMPNEAALGYYRVAYTGADLDALLGRHAGSLSVVERQSVIEDAGALVESGRLPIADALKRLPTLARDEDPALVRAALSLAWTARPVFVAEAQRPLMARFIGEVFGAKARALGLRVRPGERQEDRLLRPEIVAYVAVHGEDAALLAEARRLADGWLADPASLEPESVEGVLYAAATHGDRALFERMRAEASKTTDGHRRAAILGAIADFRDPAIASDAFALVLSDALDVRESRRVLGSPSVHTRDALYGFVKANFDALMTRLPAEARPDVPRVAEGYCDEARRADVAAFFGERMREVTGGPRILDQVVEAIGLCVAQREAQEKSLAGFLARSGR